MTISAPISRNFSTQSCSFRAKSAFFTLRFLIFPSRPLFDCKKLARLIERFYKQKLSRLNYLALLAQLKQCLDDPERRQVSTKLAAQVRMYVNSCTTPSAMDAQVRRVTGTNYTLQ